MALFQIDGITEIANAFRQLEPKLARKVIRKAARKALKPVLKEVRKRTPVASGALKKLVKIRAAKKRRRGVISLYVSISADRQNKKFHGAFVNYGTRKQKAKGFVQTAFKATKDQARAIAVNEIAVGIEQELRR